ncbi:MAG: T9SS type A sorting domain-containing protein [Chitinophagales bacterium]|nr:T9SS type A sorting domain-containing protein [Chitinophagales bacterium]
MKLLCRVLLILITTHISGNLIAQTTILWEKSLGGSSSDLAYEIVPTPDGNYLIAGTTDSNDDDISFSHGQQDVWLVKLTPAGDILWEKTYGGSLNDYAKTIIGVSGGYVVAGSTYSNNGDVAENHGERDAWVFRIDEEGELLWENTLGGDSSELANWMIEVSDGGFLCAASAESSNGDLTGNKGANDMWVFKLDSLGELEWQNNYGGTEGDFGLTALEVADGYVVAGYSYSNDMDVSGHHADSTVADFWVIKINATGTLQWQKSFGGDQTDYATNILQTTAGNYLIAGITSSDNGDVETHYGSIDENDIWLIEIDADGELLEEYNFGGSYSDDLNRILPDMDGGYIIMGNSESNDFDVSGHHGSAASPDVFVLKITDTYTYEWSASYGGFNDDLGRSIYPYDENAYIAVSYTKSTSGDISFHYGTDPNHDFWIAKLTPCVPIITDDPISVSACEGSAVTLTLGTSEGDYSYDWVFEGVTVTTTIPEITIDPVTAEYTGEYYIIVNGDCGSQTSVVATLNISSITTPVVSASGALNICLSGSVSLSTTPVAGYTYQWYQDGSVIGGATTSEYAVTSPGSYSLTVTDGSCSVVSSEIIVTNETPLATTDPAGSYDICETGSVTLNNSTAGTGYSYQWLLNNTVILGAASSAYTSSDTGYYSLVVTNLAGCADTSAGVYVFNSCTALLNQNILHANVNIYPNPGNGYFNLAIHIVTKEDFLVITVQNILGKEIFSETISNPQITNIFPVSMTHMASGIYQLKVSNGSQFLTKNLIINN